MIRTKVTRTLALTGLVPAGKLGHSYGALLAVVALCMATAAWSQTPPTFKGGRVPPNVFTGVRQPTPAAVTPASAQYRFVNIGVPGSTGAYTYGINNAGLVTGFYSDASFHYHGFVRQNGTLQCTRLCIPCGAAPYRLILRILSGRLRGPEVNNVGAKRR